MCISCDHTIHRAQYNLGWSRDYAPVLTAKPGETILFQCLDSSCGQIGADSTVDTIANFDFSKINPLAGPVYVEGAKPGDALKVTFLKYHPSGKGWSANIPGFGLLADQFKDPALHLWNYDAASMVPCAFGPNARVPLKAFAGSVGVAPAEPGVQSVVPPRHVGGNIDIRDLTAGVTLYLPVEVEGALLSMGDTHAAQGDGEVGGSAIESQMDVEISIDIIKDANIQSPRCTTTEPVTRHLDGAGYEITTGIGPDLMVGAREAVMRMVDLLSANYGLNPIDAYMLCSVCGDLRISAVINGPNWVVSFYFPRIVFN
jgi:acetamidase/formamidase